MSINRKPLMMIVAVVTGVLFVALTVFAVSGDDDDAGSAEKSSGGTAKVNLSVSGMSCGGCEAAIKKSLADVPGVQNVRVDVAGGKAEVLYDSRVMTDVDRIAAAVTASGYPAEVDRVVGAAQLQNARAQASKLAKDYVAAVDDRLIPRQDYLTELNHAKNRYTEFYGDDVFSDARGQQVLESLKAQTGQRLVDEGIQLTAIRKTGFTIEQSDLDQATKRFLEKRGTTVEEFKADLEKAGYSYAYFEKRFRNQTLIRAYQDEVLFSGAATDADKRQRYLRWFSDARRQASVVYYDPELTKLASGGGSCGGGSGSCCSAG